MAIAAKTLRVKVDDRRVAAIKLGGKRLHPIGGFGRNRQPCGDDADFDLLSVHSSVAIPASKKAVAEPQEDRKSVVQGKSVSVRVDLGGRRITKKQNKQKNYI